MKPIDIFCSQIYTLDVVFPASGILDIIVSWRAESGQNHAGSVIWLVYWLS